MKITLEIQDSKFKTFLNFIKTLDYVSVKDKDTSFELSASQKNILNDRKAEYAKGNTASYSWEEVKEMTRKGK